MKINCTNNGQPYHYSFKGIPYAKAALETLPEYGDIVVYRLDKTDLPFLKKMLKNIKLEKLAPEVKDPQQRNEWKHIIKEAAEGINRDEDVYLSTYKSKPCGIISAIPYYNEEVSYLSYVATWPLKAGENVKCAGKVLFKNIFEQAKKDKKAIGLVMDSKCPKGKRNNKTFYSKLKFHDLNNPGVYLKIAKAKDIPKVIEKEFDSVFSYELINSAKNENLGKILDINYPL